MWPPPFLSSPPPRLPPRAQLRARARVGGKNSAAATARPGGERPRSARRTTSGIGTSQNSWGWGHAATPLPQPGTFLAPRGGSFEAAQSSLASKPLRSPPPPALWGLPGTPPVLGLAPQLGGWGGIPVAKISGTRSPLHPPRRSPAALSSLRSFLSITPSASAHHHRGGGGKRLQPGTGSSRGVTHRPGGSTRAPGEQRGGGQGLRLPPAAALSPAPLPRAPPHHHAFFLLFLLLQVSHGEPS